MKKAFFAAALVAVTFGSIAPAYAYHHHHHVECHKVRVHHHWERRCR
jgi:hypothetical protein